MSGRVNIAQLRGVLNASTSPTLEWCELAALLDAVEAAQALAGVWRAAPGFTFSPDGEWARMFEALARFDFGGDA